jgi:hypothetical protein
MGRPAHDRLRGTQTTMLCRLVHWRPAVQSKAEKCPQCKMPMTRRHSCEPIKGSRFSKPTYSRDAVLRQLRLWREGICVHNDVSGECCPDFSCCHADMLTPLPKRHEWADRLLLQHAIPDVSPVPYAPDFD